MFLPVGPVGAVSGRLAAQYDLVRDDARLPVIVVTRGAPDAATLQAARRTGATVLFASQIGSAFAARATRREAQALAGLPAVIAVQPDEPLQLV